MRTLASIRTISAIERIEGADAIEKARVLGWWVVVKRGEHQPGDRVVYCEIDSLLPERPEFEFLRKGCYRPAILGTMGEILLPAGFRIKTAKLRGQVSQGICFPLSVLPAGTPTDEDADATEALGDPRRVAGRFEFDCRAVECAKAERVEPEFVGRRRNGPAQVRLDFGPGVGGVVGHGQHGAAPQEQRRVGYGERALRRPAARI